MQAAKAGSVLLEALFAAAVAAAHPSRCLPPLLPPAPRQGRLIVLAAGKAAGAMVEAAERFYLDDHAFPPERMVGLGVARRGHSRPTRHLRVVEAGHPLPDDDGLKAAGEILALAESAGPDDLVLVLLSGGGSANWVLPVADVPLEEKRALTRALQRSGADIGEINTVRKHISRIKGGRLARAAAPAEVVTLAISDVPGDVPSAIASGPTTPDETTLEQARAIVARLGQDFPAVTRALADPQNETPKAGDPIFANSRFILAARPRESLEAAAELARAQDYMPMLLGDSLEGEARAIAAGHALLARRALADGRRVALISGGELTVTVTGNGRGGPNQEYALGLAMALDGAPGICALAADTDGSDGGTGAADDPAGAFVYPDTLARAKALGRDPAAALRNNDATGFFSALGDLAETGPTHTNVNDLRVILVDPSNRTAVRPE